MRRLFPLVLAVTLLAGCGVRPSAVVPAGEAPRKFTAEVTALYFVLNGGLYRSERIDTQPLSVSQKVDLLFAGPRADEREKGVTTALPTITGGGSEVVRQTPQRYEVRVRAAVAELSSRALDQLVCTVLAGEAAEHAMAVGSLVSVAGTSGRREDRGCPLD
ncbi:hypothetical protein AB0M43_27180 [Longispora sp. NPDC051575]|uniref:hypothetical protein n=1 Tax=Longispora sp. NPDC051575 TaxID=3154943 RepID=UPI0034306552